MRSSSRAAISSTQSRSWTNASWSEAAWATRSVSPVAEHRALGGAQPAQLHGEHDHPQQRDDRDARGGERDDALGGGQVVHGPARVPERGSAGVKMTVKSCAVVVGLLLARHRLDLHLDRHVLAGRRLLGRAGSSRVLVSPGGDRVDRLLELDGVAALRRPSPSRPRRSRCSRPGSPPGPRRRGPRSAARSPSRRARAPRRRATPPRGRCRGGPAVALAAAALAGAHALIWSATKSGCSHWMSGTKARLPGGRGAGTSSSLSTSSRPRLEAPRVRSRRWRGRPASAWRPRRCPGAAPASPSASGSSSAIFARPSRRSSSASSR